MSAPMRPAAHSPGLAGGCGAAVWAQVSVTGSPRRMVPPLTTEAYTPTFTALCWAAVRRIPGSLGRSPCGSVTITQRGQGSVMVDRRGGQQVHNGDVEERPGRHLKVGHGVPVVEPGHVRPVLLGRDAGGPASGTRFLQGHLPPERAREDLLQV